MPSASHSIDVNVPALDFYALLTDFESYPTFLSNVNGTEILRRDGNVWDVQFTVRVLRAMNYTVQLTGDPGKSLSWTRLGECGLFGKNDGGWRLEPLSATSVCAHYSLELEILPFVPQSMNRRLIQGTLPEMLLEWKVAAEARWAKRGAER